MANAARVHAIESGKDARGRTLVAFGGAAPLHAARLAEKLGLDRVLVPLQAGVGSAVGFLRAPIAYEIVRSSLQRLEEFDAERANALLAEMRAEAEAIVRRGAPDAALTETRSAFMRYRGQGHEIAVPLPTRPYRDDDAANPARRLRGGLPPALPPGHSRRRSRGLELGPAVVGPAAGRGRRPAILATWLRPRPDPPAPGLRPRNRASSSSVAIHERRDLNPGAQIPGPAIIVEDETSTVVTRLFIATIDPFGYIELNRRAS